MVITVGYSYWEFEDHKDPVLEVMDLVDWAVPIGAGLAFFGGAVACGWAQSKIGAAGAGTVAEKPETAGIIIILEALPETLVILGFVVAALIILMT